MGLIAREIEARGIPTVSMSSALSITRSVQPPRAVFLDYPLGRTAGKPHQPQLQRAIVLAALRAFEEVRQPGAIVRLPYRWAGDDTWKDTVHRPDPAAPGGGDRRAERRGEPQYQCETDRVLAERAGGCASCVFFE